MHKGRERGSFFAEQRADGGGGERRAATTKRGGCPFWFAAAVNGVAWSGFVGFEGKCACAFCALVCARGRSKVRRAVLVAKEAASAAFPSWRSAP